MKEITLEALEQRIMKLPLVRVSDDGETHDNTRRYYNLLAIHSARKWGVKRQQDRDFKMRML